MKNRFQSGFGPAALAPFLTISGALIAFACADAAPDTPGLGQQVNPGAGGGGAIPGMAPSTPGVPGDPSAGPGNPPVTPGNPSVTPGDPTGVAPTPPPVNPEPGVTPPGGGTAGAGGTAECSNADPTILPIDATGWVDRACNAAGIQGAWYCYDDGVNPSGCVADTPPYTAEGMCLTGNTTVDTTFAAWGAGIGLSLNDSGTAGGTMVAVKSAYDAAANGVTGFNIVLSGDSGGLPIRVNFSNSADTTGTISPFVEVPGVGSYPIAIADALVPVAWEAPESGTAANPNGIFDIQVQIVGGETATDYHVCIESITPITDGTVVGPAPTPGGTLANYGSPVCDNFAEIALGGQYMVQNNAYNTASHCIQATWDNGSNAGFSLSGVSANVPTGGAPASYPSIVYGWHVNGVFHGAYQTAKQLSAIASAPSSWSFTVPGDGRYNASYDNWIHSQPAPGNEQGTLEHMIWLNFRDTTPIGSNIDTATLGGTTWEVWYGPNGGGWNTVTYKRATNTTSVSGLNLKEFFDDSVTRGYAAASDYLLGVQAGFEIWEASSAYSTESYSVSVN